VSAEKKSLNAAKISGSNYVGLIAAMEASMHGWEKPVFFQQYYPGVHVQKPTENYIFGYHLDPIPWPAYLVLHSKLRLV
jgi:thioredoxin reductase